MRYLVSLTLALLVPAQALAVAPASPTELYREGEVLVKYRGDADGSAAREMRGRLGMSQRARLIDARHEWLKLPAMTTVASALPLLRREKAIEFAEPNFRRFKGSVTPNDPLFGQQWGVSNTGQPNFAPGGPAGVPGGDMNLPAAWSITAGDNSVTVAIVDDGVWSHHEDLAANIAPGGASFTTDFRGNVATDTSPGAPDPTPNSDQQHGTWVAGCIGAVGNNGVGIAGAAWNVKLLPLKFDFFVSSEVAALQYAINHGAKIVNGSFGSPSFSQTELDAIDALAAADILFVVAAGNEDSNTDFAQIAYPANYGRPNVVAVAATNRQDNIASFSEYGPTTVDVAAPGLQIVSTQWDPATPSATNLYSTDGVDGTSFASPYTAGVAALLRMQYPSETYAQIRSRLIEGAAPGLGTDFGTAPEGRRTSGGRVDAAQSLSLAAGPSLAIGWISFGAPLDPGTATSVDVNLANRWLDAAGVTASLSASTDPSVDSNADVSVTSGATAPVDIAGGQSAVVHFDLSVAAGLTLHKYVYFTLQLTANGGAYSVKRRFMAELARLVSGTQVTQPFQSDLYDDFHTWHIAVPAGAGQLVFQSTTGNDASGTPIDIDLLARAGAPAQYNIALGCSGSGCTYCTSATTADCTDPAVKQGAGTTGNEMVTFNNVTPGDYYVTVVNYAQPLNAAGDDVAQYNYTLKGTVTPQSLQFSALSYSAAANSGSAAITVTRTLGTHGTVTASFATSDGTATAGTNYTATSTTVTFAEGVSSQVVNVPLLNDPNQTSNKTVHLTISSPGGGAALGTRKTATLTITAGPVASTPASTTFADQRVGTTSSPIAVTVSNSGGATLNVGTPSVSGANAADFAIAGNTCTSGVAPGNSCSISVTFSPGATGARGAVLNIPSDSAGSPNTVNLSGNGVQPALSVGASSSFGSEVVGHASAANDVTVSNSGSATLTVGTPGVSGPNAADFAISGNTCTSAVAAGNSCTIRVTFTPGATGSRAATLTIPSDAPSSPDSVALSGAGVQPALSAPASSSFTDQTVATTSAPNAITLSNSGSSALTVGTPTLTGANASDFAISSNGCASSVAPGANCTINVTFTPSATGERSATLNIPSDAPDSPATVGLAGTGMETAGSGGGGTYGGGTGGGAGAYGGGGGPLTPGTLAPLLAALVVRRRATSKTLSPPGNKAP